MSDHAKEHDEPTAGGLDEHGTPVADGQGAPTVDDAVRDEMDGGALATPDVDLDEPPARADEDA